MITLVKYTTPFNETSYFLMDQSLVETKIHTLVVKMGCTEQPPPPKIKSRYLEDEPLKFISGIDFKDKVVCFVPASEYLPRCLNIANHVLGNEKIKEID